MVVDHKLACTYCVKYFKSSFTVAALQIPEFVSDTFYMDRICTPIMHSSQKQQNNSNIYKSNKSAVIINRGIEKWLYECVGNQQVPLHR